jgi:hypothetical protein
MTDIPATPSEGGFRNSWLDHDEITALVRGWAERWPELVRLTSLGTTPEGRDLWLLTIGPEPDRVRPAAWIDGNMHASELCGSAVALAIAEDVIRLHTEPRAALHGLADHVRERLRGVLFHVLPRMSPDGAEAVLKTGRYVRSIPRDARPESADKPHWVAHDVDGDGNAMLMRRQDPGGEFVESAEIPGLMLLRRLDDPPPYWRVWPEGSIAAFDGVNVPDTSFLSDNAVDLNRNFPFDWRTEVEQVGAGAFATSEPESRAVVEFATAHPELFFWLNLHTFGGCFIRPMGDKPDAKMDPADLALYLQIGEWSEALTGYPMVSGFEEFTYEPDTPIRGDLSEYAYHHRGCVAYVVELWDLFKELGRPRPKRFVDYYTRLGREGALALARWDREHDLGIVQPWAPFVHEQLGDVEIGGLDIRFGVTNPPLDRLPKICADQSAAFLRTVALAPAITLEVRQESLGHGTTALDVTVANEGGLPTFGVSIAKKQAWNAPLSLAIEAVGCAVDGTSRRAIGHLDGWNRGLYDGTDAIYYMRSRGTGNRRVERVIVRGTGTVRLRVGSCRVGWIERDVVIAG